MQMMDREALPAYCILQEDLLIRRHQRKESILYESQQRHVVQ